MLWILWFGIVFAYYGVFTWLPSLLVERGLTVARSFSYVFITTLAQIPGYFSAAYLVDRWGRKPTLVAYLLGSALASWLLGNAGTAPILVLWGCLLSFFNLGAWGGRLHLYTRTLSNHAPRLWFWCSRELWSYRWDHCPLPHPLAPEQRWTLPARGVRSLHGSVLRHRWECPAPRRRDAWTPTGTPHPRCRANPNIIPGAFTGHVGA